MRKKMRVGVIIAVFALAGSGLFCYRNIYGAKKNEKQIEKQTKLNSNQIPKDAVQVEEGEYYSYVDETDPKIVQIGNKKTGKEFSIQVNDKEGRVNAVMELEWISDVELGIISHIDPSLSYFCIYNVKQKTFSDEKYGIEFQWLKGKKETLVYAVASPHFKEQKGNEVIKNYYDEVLYTTEENEEVDGLTLSPDGEEITVLLWNRKNDSERSIVIKRDGSVIREKKIEE